MESKAHQLPLHCPEWRSIDNSVHFTKGHPPILDETSSWLGDRWIGFCMWEVSTSWSFLGGLQDKTSNPRSFCRTRGQFTEHFANLLARGWRTGQTSWQYSSDFNRDTNRYTYIDGDEETSKTLRLCATKQFEGEVWKSNKTIAKSFQTGFITTKNNNDWPFVLTTLGVDHTSNCHLQIISWSDQRDASCDWKRIQGALLRGIWGQWSDLLCIHYWCEGWFKSGFVEWQTLTGHSKIRVSQLTSLAAMSALLEVPTLHGRTWGRTLAGMHLCLVWGPGALCHQWVLCPMMFRNPSFNTRKIHFTSVKLEYSEIWPAVWFAFYASKGFSVLVEMFLKSLTEHILHLWCTRWLLPKHQHWDLFQKPLWCGQSLLHTRGSILKAVTSNAAAKVAFDSTDWVSKRSWPCS